VLPLFAGIWKRGAGLGPAIAFLYSGPAINILAIVMTARILGLEIGIARAVGAVLFSVVIGLIMYFIYRKEEQQKAEAAMHMPAPEVERPLWQNVVYFATMVAVLIFSTWGKSADPGDVFWNSVFAVKWWLAGISAAFLGYLFIAWFSVKVLKVILAGAAVLVLAFLFPHQPLIAFSAGIVATTWLLTTTRGATETWFLATWDFAKQITPLLLGGVLVAGLLLGQQGSERHHPIRVDHSPCWWQLALGEFFLCCGRRLHVLRYIDGSPHPAGADRRRHGQGPGARTAAGRPGPEPAQHAGYPQRDRHRENGGLLQPGGDAVDDLRYYFWCLFFMKNQVAARCAIPAQRGKSICIVGVASSHDNVAARCRSHK